MSINNYRHFYLVPLLLELFCFNLFAQEASLYENYYFNTFMINPATTGAEYYPTADLSVRQQWMGFPDAPTTFVLAGSYRLGKYDFYDPKGFINKGPLKFDDRIGLGASVFRDVNGPLAYTGGILSYAYHLPVNDESRLSFGISAIGTYYTFNSSLLKPDEPDDPYLLNGNDNIFRANFNLGVYFHTLDYFIGLSADKILPDIENVNDTKKEQPSFFLFGGYKFLQNSNSFILEPSLMIKKVAGRDPSLDIHMKLYIKNLNWIALSYSSTNKINLRFGLRLYKMIYAGYNYEYSLSDIASYTFGSHEIHLGVNLGLIEIQGVRNTRQSDR